MEVLLTLPAERYERDSVVPTRVFSLSTRAAAGNGLCVVRSCSVVLGVLHAITPDVQFEIDAVEWTGRLTAAVDIGFLKMPSPFKNGKLYSPGIRDSLSELVRCVTMIGSVLWGGHMLSSRIQEEASTFGKSVQEMKRVLRTILKPFLSRAADYRGAFGNCHITSDRLLLPRETTVT
jgi:hypothetical protein